MAVKGGCQGWVSGVAPTASSGGAAGRGLRASSVRRGCLQRGPRRGFRAFRQLGLRTWGGVRAFALPGQRSCSTPVSTRLAKPRALACGWWSTVATSGSTLTGGCESATLQCPGPERRGRGPPARGCRCRGPPTTTPRSRCSGTPAKSR